VAAMLKAQRVVTLALALALGLVGACGGGTEKTPSEPPRRIVERFVAAIGSEDLAAAVKDLIPEAAVIANAVPRKYGDLSKHVETNRRKAVGTLKAVQHDLLYAKASADEIAISGVNFGLTEGEETGVLGVRIEATLSYGETTRIVKLFTYDLGGRLWIIGPIEWAPPSD
jgi:hypothetical protein